MKLGVKEMKKAYKQVKIDQIEVRKSTTVVEDPPFLALSVVLCYGSRSPPVLLDQALPALLLFSH